MKNRIHTYTRLAAALAPSLIWGRIQSFSEWLEALITGGV